MRARIAAALALAACSGAIAPPSGLDAGDAGEDDTGLDAEDAPALALEAGAAPTDAGLPDDAGADLAPPGDAHPDLPSPPDALPLPPDALVPAGPRREVLFEAETRLGVRASFELETPLGPGEALFLEARGQRSGIYRIAALRGPSGPLIGEPAGERLSRASANPETATALLPNDDALPDPARFSAGAYDVWVSSLTDEAGEVNLRVLRVRGPARGVTVHALVPAAAAFAGEAGALETFAATLTERLDARLGLEVEVLLHDLPPEAPSELFLDVAAGDLTGLAELAGALPPDLGPGLRIYLLDQIHDGLNTIGGLSGGLPVPAEPGDGAADIVALRAKLLPDFPAAVADAASHELGHALGLWHTTEPFGDRADPLADTPVCPLVCDADGDGLLLARECGAHGMGEPPCRGAADNFMFWTLGGEWTGTPGQARVVARHPALR